MSDRFTLLLISFTAVIAAFFIGLAFGRSIEQTEKERANSLLQVSLDISTGSIRMERSDPHIRVIVNGRAIEWSGSLQIAK